MSVFARTWGGLMMPTSENLTSRADERGRGVARLWALDLWRGARGAAGHLSVAGLLLLPAGEAVAQAAPNWLLGKSIELQWRLGRSFDPVHEGEGQTHTDVADTRASVYISALGRIFAKTHLHVSTSNGGEALFARSKSPDAVNKVTDWGFQGAKLYGFQKMGADAASAQRVAVQFDASSQTCSMTVDYGRPHGSQDLIVRGWSGNDYYLRHYELLSSSCEVKSENVFSGPNADDTPDESEVVRHHHKHH
ncbi:MAG: hypothetical protein ABSC25_25785 [Roseiarcus sp.]